MFYKRLVSGAAGNAQDICVRAGAVAAGEALRLNRFQAPAVRQVKGEALLRVVKGFSECGLK